MGYMDRDLAFSIPHMRRFQELGIKGMEVAMETAQRQEESMRELRDCVRELPDGVDCSGICSILDQLQGTMVVPGYDLTRRLIRDSIDHLAEVMPRIDREMGARLAEVTLRARKLEHQCISLVGMLADGSTRLPVEQFQRRMERTILMWETEGLSRYLQLEQGEFVYQWTAIAETMGKTEPTTVEMQALLEVLLHLERQNVRQFDTRSQQFLSSCLGWDQNQTRRLNLATLEASYYQRLCQLPEEEQEVTGYLGLVLQMYQAIHHDKQKPEAAIAQGEYLQNLPKQWLKLFTYINWGDKIEEEHVLELKEQWLAGEISLSQPSNAQPREGFDPKTGIGNPYKESWNSLLTHVNQGIGKVKASVTAAWNDIKRFHEGVESMSSIYSRSLENVFVDVLTMGNGDRFRGYMSEEERLDYLHHLAEYMDELDENDPFIKGYEYSGDIYLLKMAMVILSLAGGAADGIDGAQQPAMVTADGSIVVGAADGVVTGALPWGVWLFAKEAEERESDEGNSKYSEALDSLNANNKHHILQEKHSWDRVVDNPSSWDEVSEVLTQVLEKGIESPYGKTTNIFQKVLNVNGSDVLVKYTYVNGKFIISDAWVMTR